MREFEGGATRDDADQKLSYTGFFDPKFLNAFAHYMHRHRATAKGLRGADNWKAGFPNEVLLDSLLRHVMDIWLIYDKDTNSLTDKDGMVVFLEDAIMGAVFNLQAIFRNENWDFDVKRDGTWPWKEEGDDAVPGVPEQGQRDVQCENPIRRASRVRRDGPREGGA